MEKRRLGALDVFLIVSVTVCRAAEAILDGNSEASKTIYLHTLGADIARSYRPTTHDNIRSKCCELTPNVHVWISPRKREKGGGGGGGGERER